MERMEYKGYYGTVEYSIEAGCLYGRVENIGALVTYEAENMAKLEEAFRDAVDDYLALLEQIRYK